MHIAQKRPRTHFFMSAEKKSIFFVVERSKSVICLRKNTYSLRMYPLCVCLCPYVTKRYMNMISCAIKKATATKLMYTVFARYAYMHIVCTKCMFHTFKEQQIIMQKNETPSFFFVSKKEEVQLVGICKMQPMQMCFSAEKLENQMQ